MLPLLLAQAEPAPAVLASWISVLFYLGGFVATVLGGAVALKSLREKKSEPSELPQPLVVKPHQESSSRAELDKIETQLHGRLKRERAEIDAQLLRVEQTAATRADKLEEKIDANTSLTSQMNGVIGQINQSVQLILTTITK